VGIVSELENKKKIENLHWPHPNDAASQGTQSILKRERRIQNLDMNRLVQNQEGLALLNRLHGGHTGKRLSMLFPKSALRNALIAIKDLIPNVTQNLAFWRD
jgi:hypothetical protein